MQGDPVQALRRPRFPKTRGLDQRRCANIELKSMSGKLDNNEPVQRCIQQQDREFLHARFHVEESSTWSTTTHATVETDSLFGKFGSLLVKSSHVHLFSWQDPRIQRGRVNEIFSLVGSRLGKPVLARS